MSSNCTSCGRPGEPYEYKGIEFDGLCAWKGERLCHGCRDARMSLIEQAARNAPVVPRVRNGRGLPLGTVSVVSFPICPDCWHGSGSHCGDGAHLEARFGPVCTGGGKHCDQCPGNRCRLMSPITDRHGNVLILTPDRAASYYPKASPHEAPA